MGENGALGGGMSPADISAIMRGNGYGYNDGWGGNGCWWIVLLFFAMIMGGNGFGWGNNGFQNAIGYENLATSNEVQRGFDNQNSMANEREILASINSNSLMGIQNANQNTQYMTGMLNDKYNELQRDIAGVGMLQQQTIANQNDCCCSTKMLIQDNTAAINAGISQNRYEAALNTAAITQAIQQEGAQNRLVAQQEGAATRQMIQENKIEALQQKVQSLEMQSAMCGVVRYPMSTTYNAGFNPFCNCACGPNMCGM